MGKFIKAGRIFYGIMIIGLSIQQIFYAEWRPVIFPAWHLPWPAFWVWLLSVVFIAAGIAIIIQKKARGASLLLGAIFLTLLFLFQVPYEIIADQYRDHLGSWSAALKELVFAGGAFVVAGSLPESNKGEETSSIIWFLEKFIPVGRILVSITMVLFGIDHFLYVDFVSPLVPAWMPGHIFWTYFAGAALIASGMAIILKIQLRLAAVLLGLMIFLWLVLLHIPRAIADPYGDKGNELSSVFEALGFSGIVFIIAFSYQYRKK
jgi:uncharacterized membrane protein